MRQMSQVLFVWWNSLLHPAQAGELIMSTARQGLFRRLVTAIALLYAFYGFSMGLFRGYYPAVISCFKLSLLYLCTLAICLPSLYVLNCMIGPRLRFIACVKLLILALSVNAVALGSYVLISLFFTATSSRQAYTFLVLMHVCVFGLAGLISMAQIGLVFRAVAQHSGRSLRPAFLVSWGALYAFVGTQMSWLLRPWIGSWSLPYSPFRPIQGSFIEAVYKLIF